MSSALQTRIGELIRRDKLGNGSITESTVAEIALLLVPPPDSADARAERAACLREGRRVHARLRAITAEQEESGGDLFVCESLGVEVRRLGEQLEAVRLSLHRRGDEADLIQSIERGEA